MAYSNRYITDKVKASLISTAFLVNMVYSATLPVECVPVDNENREVKHYYPPFKFNSNRYDTKVETNTNSDLTKFEVSIKEKNNIEREAENLFGSMRDATPQEAESINQYIHSISQKTGINFFDLC